MSLTQKWLREHVQLYPNSNRVYNDIDNGLVRFSTLRPKSAVYTFDDGRTQLLLCVHGLLPISYRGASYNIPIALWIPREYPRLPPISYVVPTNDMLVKSGNFIDVSGRCNIEYIQHWERKDEGCTLSALLEALQDYFSREPPVYSKPKDVRQRPPTAASISQRYADKPPPPVPTPGVSTPSTSSPSGLGPGSSPGRPAIPSKPASMVLAPPTLHSPEPQRPANLTALAHSSISAYHSQQPAPPPPPPPPHPPHISGKGISSYTPSPNYSSVPHVRNTITESTFHRADPPSGYVPTLSSPLPLPPFNPTQPAVSPPPPVPPPIRHPEQSHVVPTYSIPIPGDHPPPVHPHAPIPDFLDEDENSTTQSLFHLVPGPSTAPPRPPNPELLRLHAQVHHKLTSELDSLSQALALDGERLRAHQSDLLAGEPAIKDEMARLEAVRDVCRSVATRTGQAVAQAEANITELRRKGDPEVDELVCATTIVHNQLINLIADDNAIEDTIYHLHRALNMGRIDLERFLRSTRVLAEEQFMKRALIEKIQASMSSVSSSSIAPDWV